MPDKAAQTAELRGGVLSATEAGQRLRAAREALGISVTEINSRIHLTREVVAALEAGDFAEIGPPVFVRGHLRSYARLLKLSAQEILEACPDAETEPEVFKTQSALKDYKPGFSIVNAILLGGLLLVLLIALVYWLAVSGSSAPNGPAARADAAGLKVPYALAKGNNTNLFIQPDSATDQQA